MAATREELLQTLIDRMMSVMRLVRYHSEPGVPVLSPPHAHVLFITMENEGISVKELAEIVGVTPGAITQFANHLCELGLVVRDNDPNDRRIVRLKVTQKAREDMKQLRKGSLASANRLFHVVTDSEMQQLLDIFSRIDTSQLPKHPANGESPVGPS